jgi:type IV pilus assembly protein PilE
MQLRKQMSGITLIELMIVVVIVSVLAAIAFPNYQEFSARAKRNEAKAALLQIKINQERFYLNNNTFTQDMTQLGFAADPFTTDTGSYVVAVTAASPSNFSATATYQLGGNEASKCVTFTIDGRGAKTSGPETNCWERTR